MGRLIYSMIASLDGYVADESGNFDWAEPDVEVHAFINETMRPIGTHLLGRRMYDVMSVWDTMQLPDETPSHYADFAAIWQAADKIVYSTTLDQVNSPRTRLERQFDPDVVREMVASSERDVSVGGPDLAARAIAAGLVDEWQLFLAPVVVGGGVSAFPAGVRQDLALIDERRFAGGFMFLCYRRER